MVLHQRSSASKICILNRWWRWRHLYQSLSRRSSDLCLLAGPVASRVWPDHPSWWSRRLGIPYPIYTQADCSNETVDEFKRLHFYYFLVLRWTGKNHALSHQKTTLIYIRRINTLPTAALSLWATAVGTETHGAIRNVILRISSIPGPTTVHAFELWSRGNLGTPMGFLCGYGSCGGYDGCWCLVL